MPDNPIPTPPRLLERVRDAIRRRHYSYRTEQTYLHWIKRDIWFHDRRHPAEMGAVEVMEIKLPWMDGIERAKRPVRVPVVLTVEEVRALLARLDGTKWLMAGLLYGAGLRLRECLKLRIKDVDFEYRQITVRDGKGGKDRVTMLPGELLETLRSHVAQRVRRIFWRPATISARCRSYSATRT